MNREVHVRFCEGLGCNSLGLLTYSHSRTMERTFAWARCGQESSSLNLSVRTSASRTLPVSRPYGVARLAHPRAC